MNSEFEKRDAYIKIINNPEIDYDEKYIYKRKIFGIIEIIILLFFYKIILSKKERRNLNVLNQW